MLYFCTWTHALTQMATPAAPFLWKSNFNDFDIGISTVAEHSVQGDQFACENSYASKTLVVNMLVTEVAILRTDRGNTERCLSWAQIERDSGPHLRYVTSDSTATAIAARITTWNTHNKHPKFTAQHLYLPHIMLYFTCDSLTMMRKALPFS